MAQAVVSRRVTGMLISGQPGTGKSYVACRELVEVILPNLQGHLYTNLPLKVEEIVAAVAAKKPKGEREAFAESLRSRIHLIPQDEAERWEKGESGPSRYFENLYQTDRKAWEQLVREEGLDPSDVAACEEDGLPPPPRPLAKGLLVVDEAGRCWPAMASGRYKDAVAETSKFLKTIRHEGAQFWAISQHEKDVDVKIRRLLGVRYFLVNWRNHRDPVFNIEVDDWIQLVAKLTGKYNTGCTLEEYVTVSHDEEELQRTDSFWLESKYFSLYDSHNIQGQRSGSEQLAEWQYLSWPGFLAWWLGRNWFPFGWRMAAAVALVLSWVYLRELRDFATVTVPNHVWPYLASYLPGGEKSQAGPQPGVAAAAGPGSLENAENAANSENGGSELVDGEKAQSSRSQIKALIKDLEATRQKLAAMETRFVGERGVVAVVGNVAISDDGELIHVGEKIEVGGFQGRLATSVDAAAGVVVFDDRTRFRVQRRKGMGPPKADNADPAASVARVPGASVPAIPPVAGSIPGAPAGVRRDGVGPSSPRPFGQRDPGTR